MFIYKTTLNAQCFIDLEKHYPSTNFKLVFLCPRMTLDIFFNNFLNLCLNITPFRFSLDHGLMDKKLRLGFDLQVLSEKPLYKKSNLVLKWNLLSFRPITPSRDLIYNTWLFRDIDANFLERYNMTSLHFYIGVGKNGYNCLLNTDLANIFLEQMTNRYFLVEAPLIKIYPRKSSKLLNKYSFSKDSKERFLFAQPPVQDTSNEVEITVKPNIKEELNSMKLDLTQIQIIKEPTLTLASISNTHSDHPINSLFLILLLIFMFLFRLYKYSRIKYIK
uniref:Uncharacterized protein n=1 Tax=Avrainvillea mazei TaxID=381412 RepID=A0A1X9RPS6_9CHLO|nr:hypothetical protein [Avrainvillea mazei]